MMFVALKTEANPVDRHDLTMLDGTGFHHTLLDGSVIETVDELH